MSSQPIAHEIVDWWLALTGREPGPEQGDLIVPPPSQTDKNSKFKKYAGGRITFDGDYSWKYIKAFTIKMGLWLVDINLGFSVTLKLAADFFAKGAEASVFIGGQAIADFVTTESKVLKEALTLENLKTAVAETRVRLLEANTSATEVDLGVTDMTAQVEEIEATAEKMSLLVEEMSSVVTAQELLISEARAVGRRTRAGVRRGGVTGVATTLSVDSQSIDGSAIGSSGSVVDVAVDEDLADGVHSETSSVVTTVDAHSETG